MKKLLEIKGLCEIVLESCMLCPLNYEHKACKISLLMVENGSKINIPFLRNCSMCDFPKNCPLPDVEEEQATEAPADVWPDDENNRLGPNGERLVAVTIELGIKDVCGLCFYDCESGQEVERMKCIPRERKDGRNIRWELA